MRPNMVKTDILLILTVDCSGSMIIKLLYEETEVHDDVSVNRN